MPSLQEFRADHNKLSSVVDLVSLAGARNLAVVAMHHNPVMDRLRTAGIRWRSFFVFLLPVLQVVDDDVIDATEQDCAREAFCTADGRIVSGVL